MLERFGFSRSLVIVAVVSLAASVGAGSPARAQSDSDPLVRRAIKHLGSEKHQKDIFSILHFGSTMGEYTVKSLHPVADRDGDLIPGAFAIKVVYDWDTTLGANVTTATFFFDKNGYVTDIKAKSTSILSTPFDIANATIQVVGELLISLAKEGGATDKQVDEMRQLVSKADSRGLLMLSMNVQLLAGR